MASDLSLPRLVEGATVHVVDDDVLTFDGETLSRVTGTHAAVLRLVDGTRTVAAIARASALPEDQVRAALDSLAVVDLSHPVPDDAFRRPDHVGVAHDQNQAVLLDLRDGERHVLSATASVIWETLMDTGSLAAAVAELEAAFPGTPGLADDVVLFVRNLEGQGLLDRA